MMLPQHLILLILAILLCPGIATSEKSLSPTPNPKHTTYQKGDFLGTYKVKEFIQKSTCNPEEEGTQRELTWHFARWDEKSAVFIPELTIVNPFEHPTMDLTTPLKSIDGLPIQKLGVEGTVVINADRYGILTTKIKGNLSLDEKTVYGKYSLNFTFEEDELQTLPFTLWKKSNAALAKQTVDIWPLPIIDKEPCYREGKWEGTRVKDAKPPSWFPKEQYHFTSTLRKGEEFFAQSKVQESSEQYRLLTQISPNRADGYWRLARNYFVLSEHLPQEDRTGRLEYLKIGLDISRQAVRIDPNNGESLFFLTAILGRHATTKGILNAIRVTGDLEKNFKRTLELKPPYNFAGFVTMGDTYCGLGIYYRLVPDLWIVKAITGSRGNIDQSIEHLKKSLFFQPYRVEYNKELGVSYICRGYRQNRPKDIVHGKEILTKALKLPNLLRSDFIDKDHIREILQNPEKACGYSRDGFQDVSSASLKKISLTP